MPLEEGQALIESLDGVEAMWCYGDREVVYSSGFLDREHKS
jgi:thiamine biosynthesis lipoprotein